MNSLSANGQPAWMQRSGIRVIQATEEKQRKGVQEKGAPIRKKRGQVTFQGHHLVSLADPAALSLCVGQSSFRFHPGTGLNRVRSLCSDEF
jgi:hypothetical protein